jgi:hypothetical protein
VNSLGATSTEGNVRVWPVAWKSTGLFCLRLLPKRANGLLISARPLLEL